MVPLEILSSRIYNTSRNLRITTIKHSQVLQTITRSSQLSQRFTTFDLSTQNSAACFSDGLQETLSRPPLRYHKAQTACRQCCPQQVWLISRSVRSWVTTWSSAGTVKTIPRPSRHNNRTLRMSISSISTRKSRIRQQIWQMIPLIAASNRATHRQI